MALHGRSVLDRELQKLNDDIGHLSTMVDKAVDQKFIKAYSGYVNYVSTRVV